MTSSSSIPVCAHSPRRLITFGVCGITLLLTSLAFTPTSDPAPIRRPLEAAGLLVKFRGDATDAQLARALQRAALRIERHLRTDETMAIAASRFAIHDAIERLTDEPAVELVEPNWVYQHHAVANDPYYVSSTLWGMYGNASTPANANGSQAAEAWIHGNTGSPDVVVAVVDEGIEITHPDLAGNIWVNPGEIPGNGADDDANGFVDDVNGWDFFSDDRTVFDGPTDDHGTHVAGTIGATGNNGRGVTGVNWNVKMISVKFLGPNGGYLSDAVDAINYVVALKNRGVNIVACNASWGSGGYSYALHQAINNAAQAGILFVCSAGNSGLNNDQTPQFPSSYRSFEGPAAAGYDAVIAVASITSSGAKSSFSNYGAASVDLGAPGSSILSTLPRGRYGYMSGTSMATPHVTGGIALYAASHPDASPEEIRDAIQASVIPTHSLRLGNGSRLTPVAWGGRLNLGDF